MENKYQKDLLHIRSMMEQSTKFISLSGLSGISAGIVAIIGSVFAYFILDDYRFDAYGRNVNYDFDVIIKLIILAFVVLLLAVGLGIFFTIKKSHKKNIKYWNSATKNLLIHLIVPLLIGGIFCIALFLHDAVVLIAPSMLIFYGISLINASKFTYGDIKWLGYFEVFLGLIALFITGYGLIFWTIGFGLLHIIYGFLMYHKYDKS